MSKRKKIIEELSKSSLSSEELEPAPKKRKRRRKKIDVYDKSMEPSKSSKHGKSLLIMRSDTRKIVINDKGLETPKKTSVMIRETPIKGLLDQKSVDSLNKALATSVPTHTPLKEVEYTETGTPVRAISKSGRVLNRTSNNGLFHYFSNEAREHKKPELTVDPDFESSSITKKIKFAKSSTKKVIATINVELLIEVAKQIKKSKGKRCVSQNKVMGGPATEYTQTAGISLDDKSEWAHLVAHRFLGDLAQHQNNLASTTGNANTEMMPVEDIVHLLATSKLGPVKIEVTAHLIGKTQIASSIEYNVHVGMYIFPFSFQGQQLVKPDIANSLALDAFFKVLISEGRLDKSKSSAPLSSPTKYQPKLLFSKSKNTKIEVKKKSKVLKEPKSSGF